MRGWHGYVGGQWVAQPAQKLSSVEWSKVRKRLGNILSANSKLSVTGQDRAHLALEL